MNALITIDHINSEYRNIFIPGSIATESGDALEFEINAEVGATQPQQITIEWADEPLPSQRYLLEERIKLLYLSKK